MPNEHGKGLELYIVRPFYDPWDARDDGQVD